VPNNIYSLSPNSPVTVTVSSIAAPVAFIASTLLILILSAVVIVASIFFNPSFHM